MTEEEFKEKMKEAIKDGDFAVETVKMVQQMVKDEHNSGLLGVIAAELVKLNSTIGVLKAVAMKATQNTED